MASKRGRKYGGQVGRTAPLPVRVRPVVAEKANRVADAVGVSLAAYVEALIARDQVDEAGYPVWWPEPPQEELPLTG